MITIKTVQTLWRQLAWMTSRSRWRRAKYWVFLGANGAGKSTTSHDRRFIAPRRKVTVCAHDIERRRVAAKSCMGYLPEGAPLR